MSPFSPYKLDGSLQLQMDGYLLLFFHLKKELKIPFHSFWLGGKIPQGLIMLSGGIDYFA